MKKALSVLALSTMLVGSLAACGEKKVEYTDGTYEAAAQGNNGEVKVKVTVADSKIATVEVVDHAETAGIFEQANDVVPAAIVEKQTTEVDTVTGATNTSKAIIEATKEALKGATK